MALIATDTLVSMFNLTSPIAGADVKGWANYYLNDAVTLNSFRDFLTKNLSEIAELTDVIPQEIMDDVQLSGLHISITKDAAQQEIRQLSFTISTTREIAMNSQLGFLPNLKDVTLLLNIISQTNKNTYSANINGTFVFGAGSASPVGLAVGLELPTKIFKASLIGKPSLSSILNTMDFGMDLSANNTALISSMNIVAGIEASNYSFGLEITDVVKKSESLGGYNFDIDITDVKLNYQWQNGQTEKTVSGTAVMKLNTASFDIFIQYVSGANSSKIITGKLSDGQKIHLEDLIDSNDVPETFKNLTIDKIDLSYDSTSGFIFDGKITDLLQWDGSSFSLAFYYSTDLKKFKAKWQKAGGKAYNISSYNLGGLASMVDPLSAEIDFSVGGGITTASTSIRSLLNVDPNARQQPTLNIFASKTVQKAADASGTGSAASATTTATPAIGTNSGTPTATQNSGSTDVKAILQFGTVVFEVDMSKSNTGNQFTADYKANGASVDLKILLTDILPMIGGGTVMDLIPSVSCSQLSVTYNSTTKAFSFIAKSDKPTTLDIANTSHDIIFDIELDSVIDPQTNTRKMTGKMSGKLDMGGMEFDISYDIGAAKSIDGYWKAVDDSSCLDFRKVTDAMGMGSNFSGTLPSEFDVSLREVALELNITSGYIKFSAITQTGVDAFFIANKKTGTWGFVFGIYIKNSYKIDQLPVIGKHLSGLDFMSLKDTCLLFSTIADPQFSLAQIGLPAIPNNTGAFGQNGPNASKTAPGRIPGNNVPAAGKATLNLTTVSLQPGLFASFEVDLTAGNNKMLGIMQGLAGKSTLTFCAELTDPMANSYIETILGDPFVLKINKKQFSITKAALKISLTGTFTIQGGVSIPMGPNQLLATTSLDLSETGIQFTFDIQEESSTGQPVPIPFGLKGLKLDELDIEMGVTFDPPAMDLGLEGKFNIINQPANSDNMTIMLSIDEEVPNINYFSAYIAQLDVKEIVVAATGNLNPDIPDIFNAIQASELSLYWCEAPVTLPDNTTAQPGFGFNGIIDIKGFGAHAGLTMSTAGGISGNAQMSPINLGPLKIEGTGKGLSVTQQQINGNWLPLQPSFPGQSAASAPTGPTRLQQVVPPGGPFIDVSSHASPYFDLSFQVSLFNFVKEQASAQISDTGLSFELQSQIGSLYHSKLSCTINSQGFNADAEIDLNIDVTVSFSLLDIPFGPYHINTGFDTSLAVDITKEAFNLTINGDFWFEGFHLTLPQIELDVTIQSLDQLPGIIENKIKDAAADIFKDIAHEAQRIFDDAKKIADDIAAGAEKAISVIGDEAAKAATAIADEAEKVGADVRQGIQNAEAKVAQIGKDTDAIINQGINDVKQVAADVDNDIRATVQDIENLPGEAAKEVNQLLGDAKVAVEQIGADIEKLGADLAQAGKDIAAAAEAAAAAIVNLANQAAADIRKLANEFADAAKQVVQQIFNNMAHLFQDGLRDMVQGFSDLKGYFDQVGPQIIDGVKNALAAAGHAISSAAHKVGSFFRHLF